MDLDRKIEETEMSWYTCGWVRQQVVAGKDAQAWMRTPAPTRSSDLGRHQKHTLPHNQMV
jgi:hypothetical protein